MKTETRINLLESLSRRIIEHLAYGEKIFSSTTEAMAIYCGYQKKICKLRVETW